MSAESNLDFNAVLGMAELFFEEDGSVSLWIGQKRVAEGSNFLRDQYGLDYYDPDNQECVVEESTTPFVDLVSQLSYSESFQDAAVEAAQALGLTAARWVMAQYDLAYDPVAAGLTTLPNEPVFLGRFKWHV